MIWDFEHETHEYRQRTAGMTASPGVMSPTFMCAVCKRSRSAVGRQAMVKGYKKSGYACAECDSRRKSK